MSDPAGTARDREGRGESLARDAGGIEQYGGHDFHVGRQAAAWFDAPEHGGQTFFKMRRELQTAP